MRTRRRTLLLGALPALSLPGLALAQPGWRPDRPVRLVVAFAPGGNVDFTARLLAPIMAERLGQPVVIENRGGAGGVIGLDLVAKARPDGLTFGIGSSGTLTISPLTTARMPWDTWTDFTFIALAYRVPIVLASSATLPARNLQEFLAYAKANQGKVSAGSSGIGTGAHLGIELFNHGSGAGLTHVPYRSSGAAYPDLVAGHLHCMFDQLSAALPLHRDGKSRILATGSAVRSPQVPEAPTLREAGIIDAELSTSIGLLGPARLQPEILEALRAAMAAAVGDATVQARLLDLGAEVATPAQMNGRHYLAVTQEEFALSRQAVEIAGLKPE
jgi:tripartite-type tricarboxylate transporter receptor subunit TctC